MNLAATHTQAQLRAITAIAFFDDLAAIVTARGASLRLGFKGRFAYLQAQWPGAEEALSLLRAENYDAVRYLTEAEESQHPEDAPTGGAPRLQAERMALAFEAVEMRREIDSLLMRMRCRPRLTNDGKRAWVCVLVEDEWIPVIRCRKGALPERLTLHAALTIDRPDVRAIRRRERRARRALSPSTNTTEPIA